MIYLDINDIIDLHNEIIKEFGGLSGIKDKQQLESILQHIKNDEYYSNIVQKATHLFFGIIKFHCFNDGNKRTAIGSLGMFLEINNFKIPSLFVKLEDIAIGVAKNEITKDELKKIIKSIIISFGYNINS
ncbi:MAG: type II toxin-antitoxin system death-on-curing family toxin [Candidatus Gracilibacteria bacterium]|nr:type II toxin-antitoxin system death-on-curing family toxin [Candidatus Gracilibacteria bacterium]